MSSAKKISAKMADGRDLFYFDDADSSLSPQRKPDTRELDPRPAVAQMRLDSLTGEWVSVAAHRHGRAFLPPANECPLCPSTDENKSELPDTFDVAVFENKSPSFGPALLETDDQNYSEVENLKLGSVRDSVGRCEVVVFSPEHLGSLGAMQGLGADRYGSAQGDGAKRNKLVPEGIEGRVAYAGSLADVIYQLVGGLRSGMGYAGAATLPELHQRARFMRVTTAGREESHPHDVTITHEAPNYHSS